MFRGLAPTLIGVSVYGGTSFYVFGTLKNINPLSEYQSADQVVFQKHSNSKFPVLGFWGGGIHEIFFNCSYFILYTTIFYSIHYVQSD